VPAGQYTIIGMADIETLDDFEGKKIRAFGSSLPKFFDALGAVPVAIAFGELYTSLQTGIIDALITNPTAIIPAGLDEVSSSVITTGPGLGTSLAGPTVNYIISLDSWNKISEEDREKIERISREMLPVGAEMMTKGTAKAYEELEAAGIDINHLSEADTARMAELTPDFFKLAAESLEKRGLPGEEIFTRYKELADEYASGKWKPDY
jgi:TRAP-type C4-dicarboxylate transport system substrate-binding protein